MSNLRGRDWLSQVRLSRSDNVGKLGQDRSAIEEILRRGSCFQQRKR